MIDCHRFNFSDNYSDQRIKVANKVIGEKNVKKILGFALYLNGASRKAIAKSLNFSYDTFKSFSERVEKEGLAALVDRRTKQQGGINEKSIQKAPTFKAYFCDDHFYIDIEPGQNIFKISSTSTMQIKALLLCFLDNNLLTKKTVAQLLSYSQYHVQRLNQKLKNNDISLFVDQRQGQQKNYVCTPETQAEMLQQFIINITTGKSISSKEISENLKERCNIDLPSRTIRHHLEETGLSKIKKTLPVILDSIKKTQK